MADVPRPGAVTAIGILNLLVGIAGSLCCACGSGTIGFMGYGFSQIPPPRADEPDVKARFLALDAEFPTAKFFFIAVFVAVLVLALLYLTSGIGLLKMRQWGRRTAFVAAVGTILYLLLSVSYSVTQGNRALLRFAAEMQEMQKELAAKSNQPPPPAMPLPKDPTVMNIQNGIESLVLSVYPIIVIWLLMSGGIRRAFAGEPLPQRENLDRGWGDTGERCAACPTTMSPTPLFGAAIDREMPMAAILLDGKALAATIRAELAAQVAARRASGLPLPGLATVLVGDNDASARYVAGKIRACEQVGIVSFHRHLPAATSQKELLDLIARLNSDPAIHGILVQLPLPPQIDENTVIRSVLSAKDVDGFHPENLGLLAAGHPRFVSCTPLGVQTLLRRNGIEISGKHAVVLGRSNIVGKPMALLLATKGPGGDATVTIAHSRSRDLPSITRTADILIAAIGKARFVTADMVKPGAAVVDVGINTLGGKMVGDVDFDAVRNVAGFISPVPGGVGPMTIAMLLHNTLLAAQAGR